MRRISTLQNSKEGAPKNEPRLSSDSTRPVAKVKHADRKLKCADYAVEFPAEPVSQTSRRTKLLCSQKRDIVTYLCSSIPLYPLPRPTAKATLHSPRLFHALIPRLSDLKRANLPTWPLWSLKPSKMLARGRGGKIRAPRRVSRYNPRRKYTTNTELGCLRCESHFYLFLPTHDFKFSSPATLFALRFHKPCYLRQPTSRIRANHGQLSGSVERRH
jgi:hypothetical protein